MTEVTIPLPRQFEGATLSRVVDSLVTSADGGQLPNAITFDFSTLRFIRPAGVVFLSNLVHWLAGQGTKVSFSNTAYQSAPVRFLDDSLFFEQHGGSKLRASAAPRGTTLPLMEIAHEESHGWVRLHLVPWLATRLSITQASLNSIAACTSELFNNIKDHTKHDIGSIFVQHYPKEKRVTISVSDFGIGIPAKVREKRPDLKDYDAIILAVQEGFTTKSDPGNRGAGLDYLLRTVVLGNGGEVTIYSLGSIVKFVNDGTNIRPVVIQNGGFCPGTTIDINFRTDTIEVLPEGPEDLEWL